MVSWVRRSRTATTAVRLSTKFREFRPSPCHFPPKCFPKMNHRLTKMVAANSQRNVNLSVCATESPLRRSTGLARASPLSPWSADPSCGLWTSAAVWVSSPWLPAATRAANDPSRKINNYRESMLNKPPRPLSLMIFVSASQFHIFMWLWNIREPSFQALAATHWSLPGTRTSSAHQSCRLQPLQQTVLRAWVTRTINELYIDYWQMNN